MVGARPGSRSDRGSIRLAKASSTLVRLQPVLRDARPEHFLFEDHRLTGLVDFGAMGVESVAADLARLMGDWLDGDVSARREALASYERVRPLDSTEARLITAFETMAAVLIGERWVRWHYVEKRRFDDPQAVSKGIDRGRSRLERLMRDLAGSVDSFFEICRFPLGSKGAFMSLVVHQANW